MSECRHVVDSLIVQIIGRLDSDERIAVISGNSINAALSRGEGGAEEGEEFVAQGAQAGGVGLPTDRAERLGLGGDARDRGVAERAIEPRIAAPQASGIHLVREEVDSAVDERLHPSSRRSAGRSRGD